MFRLEFLKSIHIRSKVRAIDQERAWEISIYPLRYFLEHTNFRLKVAPSTEFDRKGSDIYSKKAISLLEALKGGVVTVDTIHGMVEMTVLPGTQSGSLKRLRGKGVYDSASRKQGDHIVAIDVRIPTYFLEIHMAF